MKKYTTTTFLISSLLATSCHSPGSSRYPRETVVLRDYLSHVFHRKMNEDTRKYIVFYSSNCEGCQKTALRKLHENTYKHTEIISAVKMNEYPDIARKYKVWYDSTGIIDRINLGTANVTILYTSPQGIEQIKELNPSSADSLDYLLQ